MWRGPSRTSEIEMSNSSQSCCRSATYARRPSWPWYGARSAISVDAGSTKISGCDRATSASASRAATAFRTARTISSASSIGRLAPGLLEQYDAADLEPLLESLDHVVDRQRGDARGGQRLHLHAGAGGRARLGGDRHLARLGVHVRLDADEGHRQRVAERDQLARALGRLDAGEPGCAEHVALRRVARRDDGRRLGGHPHDRLRDGAPVGHLLARDVDHAGTAGVVEVGEAGGAARVLGSPVTGVRADSALAPGVVQVETDSCAEAMRSRTARSSPWRSNSTGSGSPLTMPSKKSLRSW